MNKDVRKAENDKNQKREVKKLSDYNQVEGQLDFFSLADSDRQAYSNTIELYDAIPKYVWGKKTYKDGRFLESIQREFVHKGSKYRVRVTPARLLIGEEEKEFLPGVKEELVEDALRKLACDRRQRGAMLDGEAGVIFRLNELRRELKAMGHTFSYYEIKKALLTCASCNMTLEGSDGKIMVSGSLFNGIGLAEEDGEDRAFVRFNPLVTEGIKKLRFRQVNYEICMSYKRALSRWLHKRLSHNYVQAGLDCKPYSIFHSTLVRDSGMKHYKKISLEIAEIRKTFKEMTDREVLADFKEHKIYDGRGKSKIIDCKYELIPGERLIQDAMKANLRNQEIKLGVKRKKTEKLLENLRKKDTGSNC